MRKPDSDSMIVADILRALPSKKTYAQLDQIAASDPDFPKPITSPYARKRKYAREDVMRWLALRYGDNHLASPSPKRKRSKRPERLKRSRNVKRT